MVSWIEFDLTSNKLWILIYSLDFVVFRHTFLHLYQSITSNTLDHCDFWHRMQLLNRCCAVGLTTHLALIATTSKFTTWTMVEPENWKRLEHRYILRTSGRLITVSGLRVRLPVCTPSSWRSMIDSIIQPQPVNSSSMTEPP